MLSDGGVISRTGTYVEVLVVDCSADVIPFLCPFGADDEITYGFDEESPFAFPSVHAMLPRIKEWALESAGDRLGFYTLAEEEEGSPSQAPATRRRRPALRAAMPSGGWCKSKAQAANHFKEESRPHCH